MYIDKVSKHLKFSTDKKLCDHLHYNMRLAMKLSRGRTHYPDFSQLYEK